MSLRLKVIEVVGLHRGCNGRTCGIHEQCGRSVVIGTKLKLHFDEISVTETIEVMQDVVIQEPSVKKRGRKKKLPQVKVKEVL